MTDREKSEIRRMIENDQAEGAMRECIEEYRTNYMPLAMQMRGYYESLVNVGFNSMEALTLAMSMMNTMMNSVVR